MVAAIGKIASPSQGVGYFEKDGYYARDDGVHREASAWAGRGAEALGLSGPVDPERFRSVLEGEVPGGRRLGRREIDGSIAHRPGPVRGSGLCGGRRGGLGDGARCRAPVESFPPVRTRKGCRAEAEVARLRPRHVAVPPSFRPNQRPARRKNPSQDVAVMATGFSGIGRRAPGTAALPGVRPCAPGWFRSRSGRCDDACRPCSAAATRTDAVQVPVEVKFEEVRRVVAWPPRPVGLYPLETGPLKVKPIHKGIYETNRIVPPTASGRSSCCERSSPGMSAMSRHTKLARSP